MSFKHILLLAALKCGYLMDKLGKLTENFLRTSNYFITS